jgi:hypothetical protein
MALLAAFGSGYVIALYIFCCAVVSTVALAFLPAPAIAASRRITSSYRLASVGIAAGSVEAKVHEPRLHDRELSPLQLKAGPPSTELSRVRISVHRVKIATTSERRLRNAAASGMIVAIPHTKSLAHSRKTSHALAPLEIHVRLQ